MVECLITSGADINAVDNVSCILCFYHHNHRIILLHYIMLHEKVIVQRDLPITPA